MMEPETLFWTVTLAVFGAVAAATFWSASYFVHRGVVKTRFQGAGAEFASGGPGRRSADVLRYVDSTLLVSDIDRSRQRSQLIRAGFFGKNAVTKYNLARLGSVIATPCLVYFLLNASGMDLGPFAKFGILSGALMLGYYIPEAYLSAKQRSLQEEYRIAFPDFLDLMVVSVDAGLSLDAALDRVAGEMRQANPALGSNLVIMGAETRAGRATPDALHSLADRLGIDEARSLAMLLQQSLELGTDVANALRTYSDEMRDKRLSRAEEKANALPVKIVLPLGLFIFPVILILVMTPIAIRMVSVLSH